MRMVFLTSYAALVLVLGVTQGEISLAKYFDLKRSEETLIATVDGLAKENRALQEEIERIQKSPEYALKLLKDRYHMTFDNEKIFFFSDD